MSETDSPYEQGYEQDSDSSTELNVPRRSHKSGRHVKEEPTSLTQLQACPLAMDCFQRQSCFQYCEMIARTQHHHELARLFVLYFHNGRVSCGVLKRYAFDDHFSGFLVEFVNLFAS